MKRIAVLGVVFNAALLLALWSEFSASAQNGGAPCTTENGDLNGDSIRDVSDAVYLLRYLFQGGPEPVKSCYADGPAEDPRVDALVKEVAALRSALRAKQPVLDLLHVEQFVIDEQETTVPMLVVEGANFSVRSDNRPGTGNLVIGPASENPELISRGGRNCLVMGEENNWEGQFGFVSGFRNFISDGHTHILGGSGSQATRDHAVCLGGRGLKALAPRATVVGGEQGESVGEGAVVLGGSQCIARGKLALAAGGARNEAHGDISLAAGGRNNRTTRDESSENRDTDRGEGACVIGGRNGLAWGQDSLRLGGGWKRTISPSDPANRAFGRGSVSIGGLECDTRGDNSVGIGGVGLEVRTDNSTAVEALEIHGPAQ